MPIIKYKQPKISKDILKIVRCIKNANINIRCRDLLLGYVMTRLGDDSQKTKKKHTHHY